MNTTYLKFLSLGFFVFLASFHSSGQQRCATPVQGDEEIRKFEDWLSRMRPGHSHSQDRKQGVYTIPVVFHIIHNGEDEGFGENISEDRILNQLDRLNEDFRAANPRSGDIPSIFQPVEADVEIEFVMARQDPDGFPTNGILRVQGSRTSYNLLLDNQIRQLKEESYWNSENYLNIWVAETGSVIGIASFPETNLAGISDPETNPEYDGVVVDNDYLGTNEFTDGSFDSYGQTLTHEIGHYLGLRHIWGDATCGNDYCDDTPEAESHHGNNNGDLAVIAPCSFPGPDSCSDEEPDMFMNFMDYTNDECMNMFTLDQKDRMRTVMENSPRRVSLLTSPALQDPIGVLDTDLAYRSVDDLPVVNCVNQLDIDLVFANHGINEVRDFDISYSINDQGFSESVTGLTLTTGENYTHAIILTDLIEGFNEISWEITSVNGSGDNNLLNNSGTTSLLVDRESGNAPFREGFDNGTWVTAGNPGEPEWVATTFNGNRTMAIPAFNTPSSTSSWLVSPVYSLTYLSEAGLFFDMSYGVRTNVNDKLELAIQPGCDSDFEVIWSQELSEIAFDESETAWVPQGEWIETFINLNSYVGMDEVRFAFIFTNRGGNNLYLDNVELTNNSALTQPRPSRGNFVVYPNPTVGEFTLTLGLEERSDVQVDLINLSGAVVARREFSEMLNHTIEIDPGQLYGLHFVRVRGNGIDKTERILIGR